MIPYSYRVLTFFLGGRAAYRPLMFSRNEVFCGPDVVDTRDQETGRLVMARTPQGAFDVQSVVERLSEEDGKPDVVLVKADPTRRMLPRGLDRLPGIKVLVAGATHLGHRPLHGLLQYAASEPFDLILSDHDRQHLHWYQEAGFRNVHWLPFLNLVLHDTPTDLTREPRISFVGGVNPRLHRHRRQMIERMLAADLPLETQTLPPSEAARSFASSVVTFNCSLNGDLNLRMGEAPGAGGCLLTDRLAPQTGVETLLRDGQEVLSYGSPEELVDLARQCLEYPAAALSIAQAGRKRIRADHNPEVKAREFHDLVFNGRSPEQYEIPAPRRAVAVTGALGLARERALYEYAQDLHGRSKALILRLPASLQDEPDRFTDLPRLTLVPVDGSPSPHGLSNGDEPCHRRTQTLAVLTVAEIKGSVDGAPPRVLGRGPWETLFLLDGDVLSTADQATVRARLRDWGYTSETLDVPEVFTLSRPASLLRALRAAQDLEGLEVTVAGLGALPLSGRRIRDCWTVLSDLPPQGEGGAAALSLITRAMMVHRADPGLLSAFATALEPLDAVTAAMAWSEVGRLQPATERRATLDRLDHMEAEDPQVRKVLASIPVTARGLKLPAQVQSDALKILMVTNLFPPDELGGYGRKMWELARGLRDRGHQVRVLCASQPGFTPSPGQEEESDVRRELSLFGFFGEDGNTVDASLREAAERLNAIKVTRAAKAFGADACVLGNLDLVGTTLMDALLEMPLPVAHTMGNMPPYPVEKTPKAGHYLACPVSQFLRRALEAADYQFPNTQVLHPGVRVDLFHRPFQPSFDMPRICFAGILRPYKGFHLFVDCLLELRSREIPFEATVAGFAQAPDFLFEQQAKLHAAGLTDHVRFLGFVPHEGLPGVMASNNIFLFPTQCDESFGMAQVEAMASGLCVIGSGSGGASEVLRHGSNGFLHERESAKAMASAIEYLVDHPDHWRALANQGRQDAWAYSVEVFAQGMEDALRAIRFKTGDRADVKS